MSKISKQPTHSGVVIHAKFEADGIKGFGFIEPAGSDGSREKNVFFNGFSTQRAPIGRGDEVTFVYSTNPGDDGRGPFAFRVWLKKKAIEDEPEEREAITTLAGEFDT
jgi:hypothetical protein